jgi:hypothetical protein
MHKIALSLSVVMLLSSAAMARPDFDPKPPPVTPVPEAQNAADCPETSAECKLICKKLEPPTGTRLGGHIECRTKHWWDDRMREDQATTTKIQENSYKQVRAGQGG